MADRVDLSWQADALCTGMDVDAFFPERGMPGRRTAAAAIAVCHQCPVEGACLEWALATNERYGIWGGRSERDRRRMRAADFTQLELLAPLEREPRRARRRHVGRLSAVRVRRPSEGQLELWWSDVLNDDRYGIWGASAGRSTIASREAS